MQIDSGIFRLVELSPFYLFGPSGHRSMWKEVGQKLKEEEAELRRLESGARAAGAGSAAHGGHCEPHVCLWRHESGTQALLRRRECTRTSTGAVQRTRSPISRARILAHKVT